MTQQSFSCKHFSAAELDEKTAVLVALKDSDFLVQISHFNKEELDELRFRLLKRALDKSGSNKKMTPFKVHLRKAAKAGMTYTQGVECWSSAKTNKALIEEYQDEADEVNRRLGL